MTYHEFKQHIQTTLQHDLGCGSTVLIQDITKNNNLHLDGLTVLSADSNISPTVYLNYYYKQYENGRSLADICRELSDTYRKNRTNASIDVSFFTDYDKVKSHIILKLIHYERNRQLLTDVPHFRFLDLAIVFQCLLPTDTFGAATILIRRQHLAFWHITKDDLYTLAEKNTPRLMPYDLRNMTDVLRELMQDAAPLPPDAFTDSSPMYMLSNHLRLNGSSCILYRNLLQNFADLIQSDFYILPSSIHEVLLIPTSSGSRSLELSDMVREVNDAQLAAEDILSDHVYYFSREDGTLTM